VSARPAAGGGRWVEVAPERLEGWLAGFFERHGQGSGRANPTNVSVTAPDGARAEITVPFPPLAVDEGAPFGGLVRHALEVRTVGVLLVRLGGHAAGVYRGCELVASKVGSRHVQGRSAAGGWSQQRFARRREGQAKVALAAAVEVAVQVLLPMAGELQVLVLGGDRRMAASVLDDPRLVSLRSLVVEPHLDVPDPRQRVLDRAPALFRAVRIRVVDP
jgi:VLRF1 release factor-like protein